MNLLKFILYSLIAYLVIRFLMRMFAPKPKNFRQNPSNPNFNSTKKGTESLDKPRFTIEAESVDYEIIEEPTKKNEE